ncbi:MAG: hypothetical protein ACJARL_000476 [Halopseudomonas sp.]
MYLRQNAACSLGRSKGPYFNVFRRVSMVDDEYFTLSKKGFFITIGFILCMRIKTLKKPYKKA